MFPITIILWACGAPLLLCWGATLGALALESFRSRQTGSIRSIDAIGGWSALFLIGLLSYLTFIQILQYQIGMQSVDFGIFVQAIDSVHTKGYLGTSLLDLRWRNLLTHHFSPIWYLPSLLPFAGIAAPYAGIVCQSFAVAVAFLLVIQIGRASGWSSSSATALALLLLLHPTLRSGFSWEIREDILALPLLAASYLHAIKGSGRSCALFALAAMFCKETFFVASPFILLMGLLLHWNTPASRQHFFRWTILVTVVGASALLLYGVILPDRMFSPTFSASERLLSFRDLFTFSTYSSRVIWLLVVLAPFGFVPLWCKRCWIYALPAFASLMTLCVSNFAPMLNPLSYYAIVPAFLFGVAAVAGLPKERPQWVSSGFDLRLAMVSAMLSLSIGPRVNLREDLQLATVITPLIQELSEAVPEDSTVIADDPDINIVWNRRQVMRTYFSRRNSVRFDRVVMRIGQEKKIPTAVLNDSVECFRNAIWVVRCAQQNKGSSRNPQVKDKVRE